VELFRQLARQRNEAAAGVPGAFLVAEDDATLRQQVLRWVRYANPGQSPPPAEEL